MACAATTLSGHLSTKSYTDDGGVTFGNSVYFIDPIGVYGIPEKEQLSETVTLAIIGTITESISTVHSVTATFDKLLILILIFVDLRIIVGSGAPLAVLSIPYHY
nr:4887_t:CDS:2 [Entrophospora candida]